MVMSAFFSLGPIIEGGVKLFGSIIRGRVSKSQIWSPLYVFPEKRKSRPISAQLTRTALFETKGIVPFPHSNPLTPITTNSN
jgi:hypothetical protein